MGAGGQLVVAATVAGIEVAAVGIPPVAVGIAVVAIGVGAGLALWKMGEGLRAWLSDDAEGE